MHRSKSAWAAPLSLLLMIVAACGGQLNEDVDDRVKMSASSAGQQDASTEAPGALPCMPGTAEGVACGGAERRCTDDGVCSSPRYVCKSGKWHVESESSCTTTKKSTCPALTPSEQDWCPEPNAECTYSDTCSARPSNVASKRTYECTGSRWTWTSAHYDVTCPKIAPHGGDPCDTSCGYSGGCVYSDACGSATFTCEPHSGTWRRVNGGLCPDEAGTADAGETGDGGT